MELLLNSEKWKAMGENGRLILKEKFNWTEIANQFTALVK